VFPLIDALPSMGDALDHNDDRLHHHNGIKDGTAWIRSSRRISRTRDSPPEFVRTTSPYMVFLSES
jgi:hypothetical protein